MEEVLHSFVADYELQQQLAYEYFKQIDPLDMEEMNLKWQLAMISVNIKRFENKSGRKFGFKGRDPARFDRRKVKCFTCGQVGHFSRECKDRKAGDEVRYTTYQQNQKEAGTSKAVNSKALVTVDEHINLAAHEPDEDDASGSEHASLLACCTTEDQHDQVAMMGVSQVHNCIFGCSERYNELKNEYDELKPKYNECYVEVEAYKKALKTLERQKVWFQKNQLAYEEKIRVLESNLEVSQINLKRTEKEKANVELEKQELQVKFDNEVASRMKWQEGASNLEKLLDSSQSVKSRRALGYDKYIDP